MKTTLLSLFLVSSIIAAADTDCGFRRYATKHFAVDQDAMIQRVAGQGDRTNFENHRFISMSAWQENGRITEQRSLIQFDIDLTPEGKTFASAYIKFSMNAEEGPYKDGHQTTSGSNKCIIHRVTKKWKADEVSWVNQPSTSIEGLVEMKASDSSHQDYYVDVSEHVQFFLDHPGKNYGFMIKLENEDHYRRMVFASSDCEDENLRPELVVYYNRSYRDYEFIELIDLFPETSTAATDLIEATAVSEFYPNPTTEKIYLKTNDRLGGSPIYEVANQNGQIIDSGMFVESIDLSSLPRGVYYVAVKTEETVIRRRVVKQ